MQTVHYAFYNIAKGRVGSWQFGSHLCGNLVVQFFQSFVQLHFAVDFIGVFEGFSNLHFSCVEVSSQVLQLTT